MQAINTFTITDIMNMPNKQCAEAGSFCFEKLYSTKRKVKNDVIDTH
jgi:hypothetical protein